MTSNSSLIFNSVPTAFPIPGETLLKTTTTLDLDMDLSEGSIIVKTLSLSLDPYLRGRMRDVNIPSYAPEFNLGQPIANFGVSVVIRASPSSAVPLGTHLYGSHEFSEYQIFSAEAIKSLKVLENEEGLPWTTWVGAAGMPGQTAWYGLKKIAKPAAGEAIFISGAAGAVGQ